MKKGKEDVKEGGKGKERERRIEEGNREERQTNTRKSEMRVR